MNTLKIIAGNANPKLAQEICDCLGTPLCKARAGRFPDGETSVYIGQNVRGADVFVIQSTSPPVNENLMELLIMIDALKRASAGRITAVIPYYGYGRQDRKHRGRVPISARLVANLIEAAGANRVLTLDLHAGQIQGFFDIPVDELYADPVLIEHFQELRRANDAAVASPDIGGLKRARAIARGLDLPLAVVEKRHGPTRKVEALNVIGDVQGKRVLIVDDIISTGGTLLRGAELLLESGAREVMAACVHGIFAEDAFNQIKESPLTKVVVSNSVAVPEREKIEKLSVARLLANAIDRIHNNRSISELFARWLSEDT